MKYSNHINDLIEKLFEEVFPKKDVSIINSYIEVLEIDSKEIESISKYIATKLEEVNEILIKVYSNIDHFKSKDKNYPKLLKESYLDYYFAYIHFAFYFAIISFVKLKKTESEYRNDINLKIVFKEFQKRTKNSLEFDIPIDMSKANDLEFANKVAQEEIEKDGVEIYIEIKNRFVRINMIEEIKGKRNIFIYRDSNYLQKTSLVNRNNFLIQETYENIKPEELKKSRVSKFYKTHQAIKIKYDLPLIFKQFNAYGVNFEKFFETFNLEIFDIKYSELLKIIAKRMYNDLIIIHSSEMKYPFLVFIGAFFHYSGALRINNLEFKDGEIPANLFYHSAKYYLK